MRSLSRAENGNGMKDDDVTDMDDEKRPIMEKLDTIVLSNEEFSPATLRWIKLAVLIALCLQNAGVALLTRYSKYVLKESYNSTEVVLVSEMIKVTFSGYLAFHAQEESKSPLGQGWNKLVWLALHSQGIIVLVVLYSFANILQFFALSKIEASLFSVLTQLKVHSLYRFTMLENLIFLNSMLSRRRLRRPRSRFSFLVV